MLLFRPMQQRAIAGVLLTDLAEQATWQPHGGGPAVPVRVLVERNGRLVDGELVTSVDEEIRVTVWRNPEAAKFDDGGGTEIDLGGVREPRIQDKLVRDPTRDNDRPYVFTGEVIAETAYTWRLLMRRKQLHQVGAAALAK